jgi:hypothetical protein
LWATVWCSRFLRNVSNKTRRTASSSTIKMHRGIMDCLLFNRVIE